MTIIDYSKTYKSRLMRIVWMNLSLSVLFIIAYSYTNNFLKNDWLALALTFLGVGIVYAIGALVHYQKPYVTLQEGVMNIHGVKRQKVTLNEIRESKSFAGDLIIYTPQRRIIIDEERMDQKSLVYLKNQLIHNNDL